jgi:hypothetical protein
MLSGVFGGRWRQVLGSGALAFLLVGGAPAPVAATASPSRVATPRAAVVSELRTPCPEVTDSIDRLYSAYFLRPPDAAGLQYWIERCMTGQRNLRQISEAFALSPEFERRYGTLDDAGFVELVYLNVLGRASDREGAAYWLNRVRAGLSPGAMMVGFSESGENIAATETVQPIAGVGRIYPA